MKYDNEGVVGWDWRAKGVSAGGFAAAGIAPGPVLAELPKEIRGVTYNIHHGEGRDENFDLERIAKVLVVAKPDIVALQEVDQNTVRSDGVDQAEELARLTGMKAVFGRSTDMDGGDYGNAVLTKLPVRRNETVMLKSFKDVSPNRAEQRSVLVVELGEKDGPGLLFLCTHCDWRQDRDGNQERLDSARMINGLIAKRGDA